VSKKSLRRTYLLIFLIALVIFVAGIMTFGAVDFQGYTLLFPVILIGLSGWVAFGSLLRILDPGDRSVRVTAVHGVLDSLLYALIFWL